jgi:glycerol-3-phosphate dehydrogenase
MAADTLDFAIRNQLLAAAKPCATETFPLYGSPTAPAPAEPHLAEYGSEIPLLDPTLNRPIDPKLPYTFAMCAHAVRHELARTLEDVLSRRTRALLLNAEATLRAAPDVANLMARELNEDQQWIENQLTQFRTLVQTHYMPPL